MNLSMFHRVRTGIQVNASPGPKPALEAVEGNLRDVLMSSGLFEEVEVEHTDDPDQLVIALCQFRPQYSEADVAYRLEQMWGDRVRYEYWEAHAIATAQDHVELEAATRVAQDGHYVTVHLVAQRAAIPSQRPASR
jgi:hypothetical protein